MRKLRRETDVGYKEKETYVTIYIERMGQVEGQLL